MDEQSVRSQAVKDGITHFSTGVAAFRDSKLLVVRRAKDDFLGGHYELPGGGVDTGETFEQGAIRELFEETGLRGSVIGRFKGFDYSTDRKPKVRQLNFAVEAEPGDVVLDPAEHDAFKWIGEEDATSLDTTDSMKTCLQAAFRFVQ